MAEAKDRLDAVQAVLAPFFKWREFRKAGRTFRKEGEPGVIQVINLQAGMYEVEPSSLTTDYYGKFTVNLGIAIAEAYELQTGKPFKKAVQEHECTIRARLGELLRGSPDLWWDLAGEAEAVAHDVIGLLVDHGLPFLERFSSRAAVMDQWVSFNESEVTLNHVPRMTVALLRLAQGDRGSARELLADQARRTTNPKVKEAMQRLADQHNLGSLDG